jgi:hypothetical protein
MAWRGVAFGSAILMSVAADASESGSFYLETGALPTKADAASAEAKAPGDAGVRILRRYVEGAGWRYVLVADAKGSQEQASDHAKRLAATTGLSWSLARVDESGALVAVASFAPAAESGQGPGRRVLEALVTKLGGERSGMRLITESPTLRFKFKRSVAPDLVVTHDVARTPDRVALQVAIVEGEGVSSRAAVGPEGAWLSAAGVIKDADPASARAQIERFMPGAVLPLALRLPNEALSWPAGEVREGPSRVVNGRTCDVVERLASGGRPSLTLTVCDGDLSRVDLGPQARIDLSEWTRTGAGLVYPHRVEVRRGEQLVEVVEVIELSTEGEIPAELFAKPIAR